MPALDLGAAVAYRLTESIKQFPNWSVFGEANAVRIGKDHDDEEGDNPNSGGWTIYLTPGVRCRFNERVALTFAASLPVSQDLNGDQIMEILGIRPGPEVGKAYKFLLELRLDNGPMSYQDAREALLEWHGRQA